MSMLIMLAGFDFKVQREQQVFSSYTTREVKYGNNIAVLFLGLYHCRQYDDHPAFWRAIARGMGTSLELMRKTTHTLSDARRFLLDTGRPGSTRSDIVVRAADAWIDFLSADPAARLRISTSTDDCQVIKFSEIYFKSLEHTMVNASSVPTKGHPQLLPIRDSTLPGTEYDRDASRPVPKPQVDSPKPARHIMSPPKLSTETEALASNADKISNDGNQRIDAQASLSLMARCAEPGNRLAVVGMKLTESQDQLKAGSLKNIESKVSELQAETKKGLVTTIDSMHAVTEAMANMREDISGPDSSIISTVNAIKDDIPNAHSSIIEAMNSLKKDVSGSHLGIIEAVNAIKGEVSRPHQSMVDALNTFNEEMSGSDSRVVKALLQPIQTMTETYNSLRHEVAELKSQQSQAGAQSPASQIQSQMAELLQEQSFQLKKLAHATAGLEDTKPKLVASPPVQSMRLTFTYPASAPSPLANPAVAKPALSRSVPKNLLQAMKAAETDLKHHVKSIQKFYYQLDSSLPNRRAAEKAADLLLALERALKHAESPGGDYKKEI
ncbi:hypothetical protein B0T26DRAFT_803798 [Lasiosphaeria miniovina]|uniref:Uncharacterized protein n=1 Tax=Lasiosphaeria miniovina TaxID=1954250 RepID=A0AA40ABK0_9PEZI|nr:uncharacterized protein B0T26DRAFT_803798 [Lasiosphaeria miniovina]KAK0712831.1 hypothetical protein B0T26DRAFT_803798 [Lasiosphaeria miniovina]